MEPEDIQRKVQFRQGSYTVTIPLQIIHELGIRRNQYVRFAVSKKKVIVIKPVESGITKKDMTEAERDSAALDKYDAPPPPPSEEEEQNGYMKDLAEALERKPSGTTTTQSRIEKLRMR